MKEIIKQSTDLYYEIDGCITELLKARLDKETNKEYEAFSKMESLMVETMQHISWLVGELKGNSQIKWQTGVPKEGGKYLVSIKADYYEIVTCVMFNHLKGWRHLKEAGVTAWCKLSDIEPYKEDAK